VIILSVQKRDGPQLQKNTNWRIVRCNDGPDYRYLSVISQRNLDKSVAHSISAKRISKSSQRLFTPTHIVSSSRADIFKPGSSSRPFDVHCVMSCAPPSFGVPQETRKGPQVQGRILMDGYSLRLNQILTSDGRGSSWALRPYKRLCQVMAEQHPMGFSLTLGQMSNVKKDCDGRWGRSRVILGKASKVLHEANVDSYNCRYIILSATQVCRRIVIRPGL